MHVMFNLLCLALNLENTTQHLVGVLPTFNIAPALHPCFPNIYFKIQITKIGFDHQNMAELKN